MKTLARKDTVGFGQTVRIEKWSSILIPYILQPGAFNLAQQNRIFITLQSLGGWMFDADRPLPLNIATLSLIHHEITHGFDRTGSKYDHKGNLLSSMGLHILLLGFRRRGRLVG